MKLPVVTMALVSMTAALFGLAGASPANLFYHPDVIGTEPWRWLTAHFVHIDLGHLGWNLLGFIVLGAIIEQHSKRLLALSLLAGVIAVDIYLELFYTRGAYAGLSGVLNTLLIIALALLARSCRWRCAAFATLCLAAGKLSYELLTEASLLTQLSWSWSSVPQAHLAGLLVGIGLAFTFEATRPSSINMARSKRQGCCNKSPHDPDRLLQQSDVDVCGSNLYCW